MRKILQTLALLLAANWRWQNPSALPSSLAMPITTKADFPTLLPMPVP